MVMLRGGKDTERIEAKVVPGEGAIFRTVRIRPGMVPLGTLLHGPRAACRCSECLAKHRRKWGRQIVVAAGVVCFALWCWFALVSAFFGR